MIFYNTKAPKAALCALAGREVRLAHDERGFRVVLPNGLDPKEGESDAWTSYSSDVQPDTKTVDAWSPEPPVPPEPTKKSDRTKAAESAAATKLEAEAAQNTTSLKLAVAKLAAAVEALAKS